MPGLHVNQSTTKLQRSYCIHNIHTRDWFREQGWAFVGATRCFSEVCVCLSWELWLNACWSPEPEKPSDEWATIFWLLRGQPEWKQNGWVTLSQHPANTAPLQHSSLKPKSAAKTNKESNNYCWNLNWPSPIILPKGNTLIEMFILEMRVGKRGFFIEFNGVVSLYCATTENTKQSTF